jgi:integrase
LYLPDITAGIIHDWMLWEAERGVSGMRINKSLQTMRVATHYAISRDELKHDPFTNIKDAAVEVHEKGILTKKEVLSILRNHSDDKEHLAILLGVLCGMRIGEVRGLHWDDIEGDMITIQHNWQDDEGIKGPKCGSKRSVLLPYVIKRILKTMRRERDLIYGRPDGKAMCNGFFRNCFIRELEAVGITEDDRKDRNLSFHSLRHTYITLSQAAGILDIFVQAFAGHKRLKTTRDYTHPGQIIDYGEAREKLNTFFMGDKKGSKKAKKSKKNA